MVLANQFAGGAHWRSAEKGRSGMGGATQCRRRWRPARRIGNAGFMPGMRMVRVRCRGLLHGGAMILLRQGGRGDRRDEDAHERLHAASPSSGRTVTTRNIPRSEEHTSELQSLMRSSYAVFCLKKKKIKK